MSTNDEVLRRIDERVARLREEVRSAGRVVVRIPDWEPVDLDEGLHWMWASLAEGFCVKSRVVWAGSEATIWMLAWEFCDPEPEWAER